MRKLEIAYLVYLVAVEISHIYFTISVVFGQDTVYLMETSYSWVLLIYPLANLFWYVIYYYGYLEQFSKGFHGLSLATFFFAGFPIITSIVHGLVSLNGVRVIPKQYKHIQHLNKLYQLKLEEMGKLSNWGLDLTTKNDDEEPDSLKSFLQRDIEQYGDEYQDYLNLDDEQAQEIIEGTAKLSETKVVVGSKAYDVKDKMRREYDWLIPIYGVQVVEELSLDELMDLALEEGGYDEDDEVVDDISFTQSDLEMPSFLGRDLSSHETDDGGTPSREEYQLTGEDYSQQDELYGPLHEEVNHEELNQHEMSLEELLEGSVNKDIDEGSRLTTLTKKDGSDLYLEDLL